MTKLRIKSLLCPQCYCKDPSEYCGWCNQTRRVDKITALKFANFLVTLGVGGYIDGTHDHADYLNFISEANGITDFLNEPRIQLR